MTKDWAFKGNSGLMVVILNSGLEEIGKWAFARFAPPIHRDSPCRRGFYECSNSTKMQICNEIEECVSEDVMRY
jgi:hypothetical protein